MFGYENLIEDLKNRFEVIESFVDLSMDHNGIPRGPEYFTVNSSGLQTIKDGIKELETADYSGLWAMDKSLSEKLEYMIERAALASSQQFCFALDPYGKRSQFTSTLVSNILYGPEEEKFPYMVKNFAHCLKPERTLIYKSMKTKLRAIFIENNFSGPKDLETVIRLIMELEEFTNDTMFKKGYLFLYEIVRFIDSAPEEIKLKLDNYNIDALVQGIRKYSGGCIDYQIPKELARRNLIAYPTMIQGKINAGSTFIADSYEERFLRAIAWKALKTISKQLDVSILDIDSYLFFTRKDGMPHHMCVTTHY